MKTILFSLLFAIAGSIPGLAQAAGTYYPFTVTLTGATSCTFTAHDVAFKVSKAGLNQIIKGPLVAGSDTMIYASGITITKVPDSCSVMIAQQMFAGKSFKGVITVTPKLNNVDTLVQTIKLYSATITSLTVDSDPSSSVPTIETLLITDFTLDVTGM